MPLIWDHLMTDLQSFLDICQDLMVLALLWLQISIASYWQTKSTFEKIKFTIAAIIIAWQISLLITGSTDLRPSLKTSP